MGNDVLLGNQGNDLLLGNQGDDTLYGGFGDDTLVGGQGNDLLFGNEGNDVIIGDEGDDTVSFSGNRSSYTITQGANGDIIVSGASGTATVSSVEHFQFTDGTINASSLFALPSSRGATPTPSPLTERTFSDSGVTAGNTFVPTEAIMGVTLNNTIKIDPFAVNTSTTLIDGDFGNANISNVQELVFGSTGTGNFRLTSGANFSADFPNLNMTDNTSNGAISLLMGSYVTAATLDSTSTGGDQNITLGTASGTGADTVTAASTIGNIGITLGDGADSVSATAVSGTVTLSSGAGVDSLTASTSGAVTISSNSTTGDTLLSGTSTGSAAISVHADAAATSGTYNIVANAASGNACINISGGTATERYNVTLGAHTAPATIYASEIGTGPQATAGTYNANTFITGAQSGDDIYVADSSATGPVGSLGGAASVNVGVSAAYIAAGSNGLETFTYSGNTYLVETIAGIASAATSTVVEIQGSHTFGVASVGQVTLAS